MKLNYLLCVSVVAICCQQQRVECQSNKVSPKLDFDDDGGHKDNSSVPATRSNEGHGIATDSSQHGRGSSGKSGPKIHGVRVTVDTGDEHKSKESKESVEITDLGKHKKRVGIHTDITFEITARGDGDSNATSSAQQNEKEDASVPIFKGRKSHKGNRHSGAGFSGERHNYDGRGIGGSSYGSNYYPRYPSNVPVYTGSAAGSGARIGSETIYRSADGWTSYVPQWTTERAQTSYPYRPNAVTGYREPTWKPCYCIAMPDGHSHNSHRQNRRQTITDTAEKTVSPILRVVDDKLERGFTQT